MTKLKRWLCEKYLPAYCRDALLEENSLLASRLDERQREIHRLHAYIDGLETAMRNQRSIVIRNEVSK